MDTLLEWALGPEILGLMADRLVTDIMVNPDGKLWAIRMGAGRKFTGHVIEHARVETILRLTASALRSPLTRNTPVITNATIPGRTERIAGTIAPVTEGPSFAVRIPPSEAGTVFECAPKPPSAMLKVAEQGNHFETLKWAVRERLNVCIAGATGSGKTYLASVLMREMEADRVLVLENSQELVINSADHVRMVKNDDVPMVKLLETCLRYQPDRIVVGEIKNREEATVMVQAANTGHRGNLFTLHADNAPDAIRRLKNLCLDAQTSEYDIAHAAQIIAFCQQLSPGVRRITELFDTRTLH